ncbi:General transcription factor IIE subunit 2 [Trichoplax sp. H2]|nr:General transcription factor IIE subunit 2 [Trichoplax sp. H2]|eukprot:RDD45831.1 General transcription factor IIE subunit 2 [Trichoplax sp. H2]
MDPALAKERQKFINRQLAQPSVEKRKSQPVTKFKPEKSVKTFTSTPATSGSKSYNYKLTTGRSRSRFGVLNKIVNYMKERYQYGENSPLSLDELLDRTQTTDIESTDKDWLAKHALVNNEKISIQDGKFKFKPKFDIKSKKQLYRFLKKRYENGLGGVYIDDVKESLPNSENIIKNLDDSVTILTRPNDKKQVIYFNDIKNKFDVSEEFKQLWYSVSVDVSEIDIEVYLKKAGITVMEDSGRTKRKAPPRKNPRQSKRSRQFKFTNTHLDKDTLKDYSDIVTKTDK